VRASELRESLFTDYLNTCDVLCRAALDQAVRLNHLAEPDRITISELQLEDHRAAPNQPRISHLRAQVARKLRFNAHTAVQRHARAIVIRRQIRLAMIRNVRLGLRVDRVHQFNKLNQRRLMLLCIRHKSRRRRHLTGDHLTNIGAFDRGPVFDDTVIVTSLDLEEHRRIRVVIIETDAELVPIPISVDCHPVELQVVRIKIQTVDGIGIVRTAGSILVQLHVTADKFAYPKRLFFADHVFLFESRRKQAIGAHTPPQFSPQNAIGARGTRTWHSPSSRHFSSTTNE